MSSMEEASVDEVDSTSDSGDKKGSPSKMDEEGKTSENSVNNPKTEKTNEDKDSVSDHADGKDGQKDTPGNSDKNSVDESSKVCDDGDDEGNDLTQSDKGKDKEIKTDEAMDTSETECKDTKNITNTDLSSDDEHALTIDEDGMNSTLDSTADEKEDGIVVNESEIVKAADVMGKGKRPHKKKIDSEFEEFTDDLERKLKKKVHMEIRPGFGKGRTSGTKMINNVSALESKENTKSPKIRQKSIPPEELEQLKIPFNYGWRREVVIRNTQTTTTRGQADVYYHPPHGRKLRSMVEIVKHLVMTNSELTQQNFSFQKMSILEPPFEIVRYAGGVKVGRTSSPAKKVEKKPEVYIDRDGDESEFDKSKKDKTSENFRISNSSSTSVTADPDYVNEAKFPQRGRPPKAITHKRKRNSSSPTTVEVLKQEVDDSALNILESHTEDIIKPYSKVENIVVPLPSKESSPTPSKKSKPTARKSTTQKPAKIAPKANGSTEISPAATKSLCNLTCPGRNNVPPTLQCTACQCLFHPECVHYGGQQHIPFFCMDCVQHSVNQKPAPMLVKPILLPLVPVTVNAVPVPQDTVKSKIAAMLKSETAPSTSQSDSVRKTSKPMHVSKETIGQLKSLIGKTKLPTSSSLSPPVLMNSQVTPSFSVSNTGMNVTITPTSPALVAPHNLPKLDQMISPVTGGGDSLLKSNVQNTKEMTKKATEIMPPKLTPAPHVSPVKVTSPLPVTNVPTNGVDMNNAAKNGQLLTLPAAVAKRLNLNQPLALKINNMQITVPSSCFLHTNEGLKVFLPPKTFPVQIGETAKLSVTVTNDKSVSNNTSISVKIGDDTSSANSVQEKADSEKNSTTHQMKRRTRCTKSGINPANCYIRRLYGGADCMLEIFNYLNMSDLARVAMVCRTWRTLSMHPCLWREVKFRGMEVHDWQKARDFLLKRAVQCLNFKGLCHPTVRVRTWQKVVTLIPKLTSVQAVHFGQVPASALHSICERMPHLEVFTAKWISDFDDDRMLTKGTSLDIGKFCSLTEMKELRLRGICNLKLSQFSLNGGLDEIASLKQLTVLSLTTLEDVPEKSFSFLSKMSQLEVLELGYCSNWTAMTYKLLGELNNLHTLRLESGNDPKNEAISEALLQLPKLENLQLILFNIDKSLSTTLTYMSEEASLRSLTLWPDSGSGSPACTNSITLDIISKLKKLSHLEWGIIGGDVKSDFTEKRDKSKLDQEWVPLLQSDAFDPSTDKSVEYIQVFKLTADLSEKLPDTYIKVCRSQPITPQDIMESSEDAISR